MAGNGHIFLPLKGCRGIVYTHGVRMGGRVGGGVGESLSVLYLRNRKLRDVGGQRHGGTLI